MIRLLTVLLLVAAPPAVAGDPIADPNRSPYGDCVLCHGVDGRGSEPVAAPRIGGMAAWYLERQLTAFRAGWRGTHADDLYGSVMRTMALALANEAAVKEVAMYFANYAPPTIQHSIEGDAISGRALFDTCVTCHGADAEGNVNLGAPALTGQSDWYLVRQLNHFRTGVRGSVAGDEQGARMREAAATLKDEQAVLDVVAYINSLN